MLSRLSAFAALLAASAAFIPAAPAFASTHATTAIVAKATADIPTFDTETAAQTHCPSDIVVWLNTKSGIYHEKGMRWYGRTKHGADVCKREADAAGYRDTRNGP